MRARNIKPSLFTNELLAFADPHHTIIFEGLWCLADCRGVLEDRVQRIHIQINPGRALERTQESINWLIENGFIARYEVGNSRCIKVLNFDKHQKPHPNERPSDLPDITSASTNGESDQPLTSDSLFSDSGSLIADSGSLIPDPPLTALRESNVKAIGYPGVNEEALSRYSAYCRERRKPLTAMTLKALVAEWSKHSFEDQAAAVEATILNNWSAVTFERTRASSPRKTRFDQAMEKLDAS